MNLSQILEESAKKYSHKTALIYAGKTWNYSWLYEKSLVIAQGLKSSGVREGDRVALLLKNSPEFVLTVFALSHIGSSAVPINFILKPDEVKYICRDAGVCAIVTEKAFLETAISVARKIPAVGNLWIRDLAPSEEEGSSKSFASLLENESLKEKPAVTSDTPILILYTSGTTGNPKGAILTQGNILSNVQASIEALSLTHEDRFICILPMFHVFAWTANVCIPLKLGCPLTIVDSIRPPKPWLKLMFKQKTTIFAAVPQIYSVLADQAKGLKRWILKIFFFGQVKCCISGAAPLKAETLKKFEQRIGVPLLEGYGLTETSPVVTVNTLSHRREGSVGKCIPGVKVKIINEAEEVLKPGEEGEICVQGPNLMQGYYHLPEETINAFTKDRWFKTGDVGMIDEDGFLFIKDRIKDMIIVKGLKIYSVQVEEALLEHPAVAEAAVVGIPNPSGDETIKAFVVLKEGKSTAKSELISFCQKKLPAYKRPRDIEILTELPKNALQKVLKRELRIRYPMKSKEGGTADEQI